MLLRRAARRHRVEHAVHHSRASRIPLPWRQCIIVTYAAMEIVLCMVRFLQSSCAAGVEQLGLMNNQIPTSWCKARRLTPPAR